MINIKREFIKIGLGILLLTNCGSADIIDRNMKKCEKHICRRIAEPPILNNKIGDAQNGINENNNSQINKLDKCIGQVDEKQDIDVNTKKKKKEPAPKSFFKKPITILTTLVGLIGGGIKYFYYSENKNEIDYDIAFECKEHSELSQYVEKNKTKSAIRCMENGVYPDWYDLEISLKKNNVELFKYIDQNYGHMIDVNYNDIVVGTSNLLCYATRHNRYEIADYMLCNNYNPYVGCHLGATLRTWIEDKKMLKIYMKHEVFNNWYMYPFTKLSSYFPICGQIVQLLNYLESELPEHLKPIYDEFLKLQYEKKTLSKKEYEKKRNKFFDNLSIDYKNMCKF